MKNENILKVIGMTTNMRYVFTNRGVVKVSNDNNDLNGTNFAQYTCENLNIAVNILKENLDFKYKLGKTSLSEYTSEPRRFLNFLVETFQPENSIKIIQEWESKFGDKLLLINESVDKLIIEQRIENAWEGINILLENVLWDGLKWVGGKIYQGAKNVYNYGKEKLGQAYDWTKDQVKQIGEKGLINWFGEKAKNVWNYVKDKVAAAWNCITSGVECVMEGMRSLVMSAAGTAILTGVSFIPGVGQITNGIIFGSLLIWDLYQMSKGKGDWINVIVDALGLLSPALTKIFKTAVVGVKSFAQFGAKAASKGGILSKVFNIFRNGLTTLGSYITKAATWLGEKLGITSLANWGKKATAKLTSISDEMTAGYKGVKGTAPISKNIVNKGVQATDGSLAQLKQIWAKNPKAPIPPKGVIVKSMGKTFLLTAGICASLGLDGFTCTQKAESGELTPEQIKATEKQADIDMAKALAADDSGFEL